MSVEVTRLSSGLIVVTDAMPHLQTASLGCWVSCGSRYEQADEHGISHFLEHMAFKGTARRTARQIAEEIEAVGGDLNAGTGVEQRPITPASSRRISALGSMYCRIFCRSRVSNRKKLFGRRTSSSRRSGLSKTRRTI